MAFRSRLPLHALRFLVVLFALGLTACSGADPEPNDPNAQSGSDAGLDDSGGGDCGACGEGLVCDASSGACVECLVDAQCDGGAICDQVRNVCACPQGTHFCDKSCVPDDSADTCGDRCDPCPGDPNGTAICEAGACALDCDDGLFYDAPTNSCAACATSNDCADPSAPVCDAGVCVGCSTSTDCAGREATPVCDPESGACVECSADDSSGCGNFVCDLETGTCSDVFANSLGPCQTCTYDAECGEGTACVPAEFKGTTRAERYCYPKLDDPNADCPGGGYSKKVTRTSAQGTEPETFCSINESLTTCEAVLAYGTKRGVCINNDDCGVEPGDAICEPTEFMGASCTYLCDTNADCPPILGLECFSFDGPRYCGAY